MSLWSRYSQVGRRTSWGSRLKGGRKSSLGSTEGSVSYEVVGERKGCNCRKRPCPKFWMKRMFFHNFYIWITVWKLGACLGLTEAKRQATISCYSHPHGDPQHRSATNHLVSIGSICSTCETCRSSTINGNSQPLLPEGRILGKPSELWSVIVCVILIALGQQWHSDLELKCLRRHSHTDFVTQTQKNNERYQTLPRSPSIHVCVRRRTVNTPNTIRK